MIPGVRASIFEEDDDLPAVPEPPRPAPEQVRALSEAANFRSREPQPTPPTSPSQGRRKPRTYRTGRTAAFSAKTTPETVDTLYAIAERQGWKVGETLERALAALQRELAELR